MVERTSDISARVGANVDAGVQRTSFFFSDGLQTTRVTTTIAIHKYKQHVHCDVMSKDVCAPVKVSAHDVHVQRHQGGYAVKPSLKSGNRGLQALAQVLDEREGNAAHV